MSEKPARTAARILIQTEAVLFSPDACAPDARDRKP